MRNLIARQLAIMAMFIALCVILGSIHVSGIFTLDTFPAFLGALLLGPKRGAILGFLAHIVAASTSGFLLGFPVHLVIAFAMALTCYAYGFTFRKIPNRWLAHICSAIVAFFFNTVVAFALIMPLIGLITWPLMTYVAWQTIMNLGVCIIVYEAGTPAWRVLFDVINKK